MAGLPPPGDPIWQELIKNPAIQQLLMQAAQRGNTGVKNELGASNGKTTPDRTRYLANRAVSRAPEGPRKTGAAQDVGRASVVDMVIGQGGIGGGDMSMEQLEQLRDSLRASAIGKSPPINGEAIVAILNNILNPSQEKNPDIPTVRW